MSSIAPIFILLAVIVLSDSTSIPGLPEGSLPEGASSAIGGVVGGQFAQQEGSQETHNDKNIGFNFDKKQGSSSNFKNTAGQAGAAHGSAQVQHPGGYYPGGWGPQPHVPGWGPSVTPGWGGIPHGWGGIPHIPHHGWRG